MNYKLKRTKNQVQKLRLELATCRKLKNLEEIRTFQSETTTKLENARKNIKKLEKNIKLLTNMKVLDKVVQRLPSKPKFELVRIIISKIITKYK